MGESFTVINSSVGDSLSYNWSIDPATAAIIDDPSSPTPTFTANGPAGTYTISVTVTSPATSPVTQSFSLYINTAPGVFLDSIANKCEESMLTPVVSYSPSADFIETVNWSFPGAMPAMSSEFNPVGIQYSGANAYTVTVVVSNECGADSTMQSFSLLQGPILDLVLLDSVCVGESFTVVNTSLGDSLSYIWSIEPAFAVIIDDANSPTPTFTANGPAGTYTISVTVSNPVCDPVTQTFSLYVNEVPNVILEVIADDCETLILTPAPFNNLDVSFYNSVSWSFGGATPSSSDELFPTEIQYNNPGDYTVVVTVENECGIAVDSTSFTLLQGPDLDFTLPDSVFAGEGFTVINNSSSDQLFYSWSIAPATAADIDDASSPTPTFTANGPAGTYTISVTVDNPVCDPVTQTFQLYISEMLGFTLSDSVCVGESFTVENTLQGDSLSYIWSIAPATAADIDDASSATPTFTANGPAGTYTISVTVTNPATAPVTQSFSLYINTAPGVFLDSIANECEELMLTPVATYSLSTNFIESVNWSFPGAIPATSAEFNPVGIQYSGADTYTVTVSVSNECGMDSFDTSFSILEGPNLSFMLPDSVNFGEVFIPENNTTGDALLYEWVVSPPDAADIDDPNSPSPTFTTNDLAGLFTISVTVSNDVCGSLTESFDVYASSVFNSVSSLKEDSLNKSLRVWPVPFAGELHFSYELKSKSLVEVALYDLFGRNVRTLQEGIYSAGTQETLSSVGSTLSSGVY